VVRRRARLGAGAGRAGAGIVGLPARQPRAGPAPRRRVGAFGPLDAGSGKTDPRFSQDCPDLQAPPIERPRPSDDLEGCAVPCIASDLPGAPSMNFACRSLLASLAFTAAVVVLALMLPASL
jgi:hypothetical protein